MIQICFQSGSAFGNFIKVLVVIILKIYGLLRAENIRAVILFKDESNLATKLYFRSRLMKISERSGVLPQEQHGVR